MDILVYFRLPPTLTSTQSIFFYSRGHSQFCECAEQHLEIHKKKSLRHKIILYFPDNYFMVICVVGGNIDSSGNQHGESNIIMPIKMAFLKKHHTGLSLFTTRRLMLVLLCIIDFFPILFLYYFFRGVCMCWRLLYVSLWLYTQSSIFIKCFTRHNLISFRCASLTLCDCCSDEAPF